MLVSTYVLLNHKCEKHLTPGIFSGETTWGMRVQGTTWMSFVFLHIQDRYLYVNQKHFSYLLRQITLHQQ